MKIPHTEKLDTSGVELHQLENELFSFCIAELETETYLSNFIQKLDKYLPQFVFSKKHLEMKEKQYSEGQTARTPLEQARFFLQKTSRANIKNSGEFGELLLFLFAREVKGAQKLVSKIQTRGSKRTTIPGRDHTFILTDENSNIYMLTGEAKMIVDSNDALREAQNDLNKFWTSGDIEHEIHLASTHLMDELTEENVAKYAQYFLEDNPNHRNLKYKNIVFVGYNSSEFNQLRQRKIDRNHFEKTLKSDLQRCFVNQAKLIKKSKPTIYCFMPFETVDDARNKFAEHHGLIE